MADWADKVLAARPDEPVALVTILATEGSAPRGAGTRMAVTGGTIAGTIGGGALEHRVIEQARAILMHAPGSWRVQDYPLGPLLGQCCGGRVRLLVERFDPDDSDWIGKMAAGNCVIATLLDGRIARDTTDTVFHREDRGMFTARGPLPTPGATFVEPVETAGAPLLLFGAGHVGRAIAERVAGLPLQLAWFDSRDEAAAYPGVMHADEQAMVDCARTAGAENSILILTHDHGLDYRLVAAALSGQARFVGLIGSATKRARFLSRLKADGVDATRLTCPIGLPGITGKEPGVIAIAALAQILSLERCAA